MTRTLDVPSFYERDNAARWDFRPDTARLLLDAHAWRARHAIRSSGTDETRIQLLLVDLQKDFCLREGTLYVGGRDGRGAIEDTDRIARFVYRNLEWISDITCTMDTHFPHQIFFPSFWLDREDGPLSPHREITTEEIRRGAVRPNPAVAGWLCDGDESWLSRQVEFYCGELEKAGKYHLYLWPPHCLLGGDGHALVGLVQEARLFHSFVRGAEDGIEMKGGHTLTENYSVLAPEVLMRFDGRPLAERNTAFIQRLLEADAVVVAGQASSHCVKSSIEDLLAEILARDPALAKKVYILEDCMSAVAVPDPARPGQYLFDFTADAEAALARFAASGMHVVRSTTPIAAWPDLVIDR